MQKDMILNDFLKQLKIDFRLTQKVWNVFDTPPQYQFAYFHTFFNQSLKHIPESQ